MADEIINPEASYHRAIQSAKGFCLGRSSGVSYSAKSAAIIQRLRDRMDRGEIHCCGDGHRQAKEAFVLSITPFGTSRYYARAVVVLPTCKAGDYR